ncbi:MAG: hypothetical protein UHM23_00520, partial [Clostridia bacterium]|nr:hypothetical protein [Clostridia bacterium]
NLRNEVKCGFIRILPCPTAYAGTPRVSFANSSKALNVRNPQTMRISTSILFNKSLSNIDFMAF